MILGDLIKQYRKQHNMSMDAFSERSGLSKAYISLLEKNKHPKTGKPIAPSIETIKMVADAIGMDFNDLIASIDSEVSLPSNTIPYNRSMAGILKRLRKESRKSASDVVKELERYGIKLSAKTLYGYESGISMPNADVFVALCQLYNCNNPLYVFESDAFTQEEIEHIRKYRTLDDYGRETVEIVLDREYDRCTPDHLLLNAAHADPDQPSDVDTSDDDIMDDPKEWE